MSSMSSVQEVQTWWPVDKLIREDDERRQRSDGIFTWSLTDRLIRGKGELLEKTVKRL